MALLSKEGREIAQLLWRRARALERSGVRWVYPGTARPFDAAPRPVEGRGSSVPVAPSFASADRALEAPSARETLPQIREDLGDCQRCKLCEGRTHIVFGSGNPHAELAFVGEAPGFDEDQQGLPFVGRAGQLLTKIIESIDIKREDVYICNVLKCRPPNDRNPEPDEVAACMPFLEEQIRLIAPRVIVTLGTFAAQAVLGTDEPIGRLRGRWQTARGTRVMPTFHPAFLLRSPERK